ncbi:hypothetical protein ETAA8_08630 [Anatilimnocola aggregata]|uniref:Uncharacterized protein n=1 Tax=Anatilimnocola aggregata TaxID=2528021 RepID=A0A517Y6N5_9BACT|nr:hypothetical protein [Anatilimnocola aggregata]QDU25792.1 hypothetical protein ETAA8_08630 [Anatilimnocola aggregata]
MNEPINPYESPIIPGESRQPGAEPLGVIATFEVDDAVQWHSAALNNAPLSGWLLAVVITVVVVGLFVATGFYQTYGPLGPILFLSAGFFLLLGASHLNGRRQTKQNLERLRLHPILGVKGSWKLTVGHHEVTAETPGGKQVYQLTQVPFIALEGHDLILWLEPGYPLIIPDGGKYKRMNWMLRKWLYQVAPQGRAHG